MSKFEFSLEAHLEASKLLALDLPESVKMAISILEEDVNRRIFPRIAALETTLRKISSKAPEIFVKPDLDFANDYEIADAAADEAMFNIAKIAREALATPSPLGKRRWHHIKRGSNYTELMRVPLKISLTVPVEDDIIVVCLDTVQNRLFCMKRSEFRRDAFVLIDGGHLQVATKPLVEGDTMIVYVDEVTGRMCVREEKEFEDGRFVEIKESYDNK